MGTPRETGRPDPDVEELYATTDATVWARIFMKKLADHDGQGDTAVVDEGTMIGWFANALISRRRAEDDDGTWYNTGDPMEIASVYCEGFTDDWVFGPPGIGPSFTVETYSNHTLWTIGWLLVQDLRARIAEHKKLADALARHG